MEKLVRFHQPQEDVETIRSHDYNKYGFKVVANLYHDNCFYVSNDQLPKIVEDYHGNKSMKQHDDSSH